VLELVRELNQTQGLTVLMVVLNQGQIIASGAPGSILQPALLHAVFGVIASVIREPQSGKPLIVAHSSAVRKTGG
jgi:iron complex transport system ATP-binding protein